MMQNEKIWKILKVRSSEKRFVHRNEKAKWLDLTIFVTFGNMEVLFKEYSY